MSEKYTRVRVVTDEHGYTVAIFLDTLEQGKYVCYAHEGQHSTAEKEWVEQCTKPAKSKDSVPLIMELASIGYKVVVVSA